MNTITRLGRCFSSKKKKKDVLEDCYYSCTSISCDINEYLPIYHINRRVL